MAFPASLSSTLPRCRDPRTLNGLDSKQVRSSLPRGLPSGQRGWVVSKPLTQTRELRRPAQAQGLRAVQTLRQTVELGRSQDLWGRELDLALRGARAFAKKLGQGRVLVAVEKPEQTPL